MNFVVGSGPAGIMAATALLECGEPVTILDVGSECEADRMEDVRTLADLDVVQWPDDAVRRLRGPSAWDPTIPKLCYGSAFPYAQDEMRRVEQDGTKCLLSFARGGLSNVWGAAVLPNVAEDFSEWPVTLDEMAPHYRAAGDLLGVAGPRDELESLFPYYSDPLPAPSVSRQGVALLERLGANAASLKSSGLRFGQSRLAMRTRDDATGRGCQNAALCLSGCPYAAIWNAADALSSLLRRYPRLTYRGNAQVIRVQARAGEVALVVRSTETGETEVCHGERAFVGCGPVGTTSLILESLEAYERPLTMQFQPYFLMPLLSLRNVPSVEDERLHTLAQVFLELSDPAVSQHLVHLQLYTYNPLMREHLNAVARLAPKRLTERLFLGRLLAIQGYFHSSEVEGIRVTAHAGAQRARLSFKAPSPDRARALVQKVADKLSDHSAELGATPLKPAIRYGQPGEGNHIGGIFPMRRNPGELETDVLGQLPALPGIHLIDASVLTNLAATTFSYTMMANAHRIASAAVRKAS